MEEVIKDNTEGLTVNNESVVNETPIDNVPIKLEIKRNPDGTFVKGTPPPNPKGRPVGKTLKEWVRDKLLAMTPEEREEYLKDIPRDIVWRMAEGNPAQDLTSGGEKINPFPIYGGLSKDDNGADSKS